MRGRTDARRRPGRWLLEVYPHPAHVVLFDREAIIKYMRVPVGERRTGLQELASEMGRKLAKATPALPVDRHSPENRRHRPMARQLGTAIGRRDRGRGCRSVDTLIRLARVEMVRRRR